MNPNALIYEAVCDNPDGRTLNLSVSISPHESGGYVAKMACVFEQPKRPPKEWSRKIGSGRTLFRWILRTCQGAWVGLTYDALREMTDAVSRADPQLGKQFLAAQVEYLAEHSLAEYESAPPAPPTLATLIGRRGHWLDRDGGGGGEIGWQFRESLRRATMRRFVERNLAAGASPIGEHAVCMSYGPPGSGCDIPQTYFRYATTTGTVRGRFRVSAVAVEDARQEYDAFFRGPFGVIGGIGSCEASWYDGPATSLHGSYEVAVRRYRLLRSRFVGRFIRETQKIAHGIRKGWFLPTDVHYLALAILRSGVDQESTELIAGLSIGWNPERNGPGDFTDYDFQPEWLHYF